MSVEPFCINQTSLSGYFGTDKYNPWPKSERYEKRRKGKKRKKGRKKRKGNKRNYHEGTPFKFTVGCTICHMSFPPLSTLFLLCPLNLNLIIKRLKYVSYKKEFDGWSVWLLNVTYMKVLLFKGQRNICPNHTQTDTLKVSIICLHFLYIYIVLCYSFHPWHVIPTKHIYFFSTQFTLDFSLKKNNKKS